jgi:glucan phosphoethanolaminetransferase (alkaline phosphatase superfamily)
MTIGQLLRRPTGFLPLLLSSSAMGLVIGYVVLFGTDPNPTGDEGLAAHVFQLLLVAQLVVMIVFAVAWLPRAFRAALFVLLLQAAAAAVPVVTIVTLEARAG